MADLTDVSKRLLIVDDVPEIAELFRALARRIHGIPIEATTCTDPRVAIEILGRERFDVIVSDFRMPNVDGVEVLRAARRHHPNARRVLMTGYNELPVDAPRLADAQVDVFLPKPVSAQATIMLLWQLLGEDAAELAALRVQARAFEAAAVGGRELPWRDERVRSLA